MNTLAALIPAAGQGTRLGLGPKLWLELDGDYLWVWLARKLSGIADEILLAVPESEQAAVEHKVQQAGLPVRVLPGAATRQETILRLVEAARSSTVMIQDAVRPFATRCLFQAVATASREHGAAAAFLKSDVPVARMSEGRVSGYLAAGEAAIFQAPQGFTRTELLAVLQQAQHSGCQRQSTVQLWLDAGRHIHAVPGEMTNLKLTTPEDWLMAQSLIPYLRR